MAENNVDNLDLSTAPLPITQGGFGTTTFPVGLLVGNTTSPVTALAAGVSGDYLFQNLTSFGSFPNFSIPWNFITTTSQQMDMNCNFVANNASLVTLTLPVAASSVVGAIVRISNLGAGGFRIAQNASQTIQVGTINSTVGVGGSVSSNSTYSSIWLICTTANTTWTACVTQGNFTIV